MQRESKNRYSRLALTPARDRRRRFRGSPRASSPTSPSSLQSPPSSRRQSPCPSNWPTTSASSSSSASVRLLRFGDFTLKWVFGRSVDLQRRLLQHRPQAGAARQVLRAGDRGVEGAEYDVLFGPAYKGIPLAASAGGGDGGARPRRRAVLLQPEGGEGPRRARHDRRRADEGRKSSSSTTSSPPAPPRASRRRSSARRARRSPASSSRSTARRAARKAAKSAIQQVQEDLGDARRPASRRSRSSSPS